MLSQQEVINRVRDSHLTGRGRVKKTLKPKTISRLLRIIYRPRYARESDVFFWAQDHNGMPSHRVTTDIAGGKVYSTVAFQNELEAARWKEIGKPKNFGDSAWPPKTVANLLGCSTFGETCIECVFGDTKTTQDDAYLNWTAEMYNFWLDNIRLCSIPSVEGYGLRARKVIFANRCMGEYTGEVIPGAADRLDEYTQYHFDLDIGQDETEDGEPSIWWLDATRRGSIFRFANHSCDPNAQVDNGRCGMHSRILYVYSLRKIAKDEEITINYGENWFSKDGEPCRCGNVKCKNPPKKETEGKKLTTLKAKAEPKSMKRTPEIPGKTPKIQETKESTPALRSSPRLAPDPPAGHTSSRRTTSASNRKRPVVMEDSDDEDVAPPKKEHSPPADGGQGNEKPRNRS